MSGLRPALVALILWAAHFFGAYGLMLAFPDEAWVGTATIALGATALAALGWTIRKSPRNPTAKPATLIAAIAIAWQSLVGLF